LHFRAIWFFLYQLCARRESLSLHIDIFSGQFHECLLSTAYPWSFFLQNSKKNFGKSFPKSPESCPESLPIWVKTDFLSHQTTDCDSQFWTVRIWFRKVKLQIELYLQMTCLTSDIFSIKKACSTNISTYVRIVRHQVYETQIFPFSICYNSLTYNNYHWSVSESWQ